MCIRDRLKTYDSTRLVMDKFICTYQKEILNFFGERPASAKAHFEEKYPEHAKAPFNPTEEMEELLNKLKTMSNSSRKNAWKTRVAVEAIEANDAGWYMIFDTLSVNPLRELRLSPDHRIFEDGKEWGRYVQRVEEAVRKALGYKRHGRGGPPRNTYARHFCRFEGGKYGTNPHAHVMWFLKDVPHEWKRDPNQCRGFRPLPNLREILEMKQLWPWGWSTPKPVRCAGDAWSKKHGWLWPCLSDGTPVKKRGPEGAGHYIAKYLDKGDADSFPWTHRIKATRGLGLRSLRKTLKEMPMWLLRGLAYPLVPSHRASQFLMNNQYSRSLLKREARSERVSRIFDLKPPLVSSMVLKSSSQKSLQGWQLGLQTNPKPWLQGSDSFVTWLHRCLETPIPVSVKREIDAHEYIAQRHTITRARTGNALAGIRR